MIENMNELIIKPNIILVGKPNVGKSTLFNRFSAMKISIAHETRGATRDCIYRDADFLGHDVTVIDSGGLFNEDAKNPFNNLVTARVLDFIKEKASIVLFLVSAKDGVTSQDQEIAEVLRRSQKPVILVISKVDVEQNLIHGTDCFTFGFKDIVGISAAQNRGITELKEQIIAKLNLNNSPKSPKMALLPDEDHIVKVAIVGRPNAGKSTFVNSILNEDRVMTSEIAGTTLDAIDTSLEYGGKDIILIDTAGIRRQRSISEEIEKMAVAKSLCAMDRADVAIFMLSAEDGVTEQDQKVAGMIFSKKKACIIAVNKWDDEGLEERNKNVFLDKLRFELPFLAFAPVLFISAKKGKDIFKILDLAIKIAPRFKCRINTSKLNRTLEKAQEAHPAPMESGKRIKMFFATQVDTSPPTFTISCNMPNKIHFSYERYLSNYFRKELQLNEIPIKLIFKKKSSHEEIVKQ